MLVPVPHSHPPPPQLFSCPLCLIGSLFGREGRFLPPPNPPFTPPPAEVSLPLAPPSPPQLLEVKGVCKCSMCAVILFSKPVGGETPPSVSCPLKDKVIPLVLLFCSSRCFHIVFVSMCCFALRRGGYVSPPPHTQKPCTSLGEEETGGGGATHRAYTLFVDIFKGARVNVCHPPPQPPRPPLLLYFTSVFPFFQLLIICL
jgi:hypothetical protein